MKNIKVADKLYDKKWRRVYSTTGSAPTLGCSITYNTLQVLHRTAIEPTNSKASNVDIIVTTIRSEPSGVLAYKDFKIIWRSNLLILGVHDEGYPRKEYLTKLDNYFFLNLSSRPKPEDLSKTQYQI